MAFTAVHGDRSHEGEFQTHVYACACICLFRWEVAPIQEGVAFCWATLGAHVLLIGIHTGAHRHPHRITFVF